MESRFFDLKRLKVYATREYATGLKCGDCERPLAVGSFAIAFKNEDDVHVLFCGYKEGKAVIKCTCGKKLAVPCLFDSAEQAETALEDISDTQGKENCTPVFSPFSGFLQIFVQLPDPKSVH